MSDSKPSGLTDDEMDNLPSDGKAILSRAAAGIQPQPHESQYLASYMRSSRGQGTVPIGSQDLTDYMRRMAAGK